MADTNDEISALIDTLHQTERRLEELTAGEVDTVADREGRTLLLRRAQEYLRHRETAKQAAIVNALPAHIALLDARGVIISVNEAWRRFAGANAIQGSGYGVGSNYLDICDSSDAAEAHQAAAGIRSLLAGGVKSFSLEYSCHSPTQQRWFLMTVNPLADDRPHGAVVMHLDVTAQRLADEGRLAADSKFRQMSENIRDVFFLRDSEGSRMFYISPAYEEIWGRTCESLYANPKSWAEAIHPDDQSSTCEKIKSGMSEGKYEVEYRIVRPDGSIRWIETRGFPVCDDAGKLIRITGVAKDITDRKCDESEILATRNQLQATLDAIPDLLFELGLDGRYYAYHSPRIDLLATSPEIFLGKTVLDVLPADAASVVLSALQEAHDIGRSTGKQFELTLPQGRFCFELSVSRMAIAPGQVPRFICLSRDISERKEAQDRIIHLNRVYAVLSGINGLIVRVLDRDELFREACRIAVEAGGFPMAMIAIVDRSTMKIVPVASLGQDEELLTAIRGLLSSSEEGQKTMTAQAIREKKAVVANDFKHDPRVVFARKCVESGVHSMAVLPLIVSDEAVGALALYASESEFFHEDEMKLLTELAGDIAFAVDHIEKRERLDYLAYFDSLTGLPNRNLIFDRLELGTRSSRSNQKQLALLSVDLDNFKGVIDTLGHSGGDILLQEAARRLALCLRDTDTVGRLGGDEFAIILPEIDHSEDAAMVARKVIESSQKPYLIKGYELFVSASVGITMFPDDAVDGETLLRNANTAMFRAKAFERNGYQFFTAEMNRNIQDKMKLEADLRYALAKDEFLLHYQPKVSCTTGKVTGFEALLRWQHPTRGLVGPDDFIPLLEETGLIVPVGEWVLSTACAQARLWHDEGLGTPSMAVNVSGQQIHVSDLCETVRAALAASGLAPAYLELELTESQLMKDAEGIIDLLRGLKAMGVSISVDDFGTGYSSLAYLKRFPIDSLKVDRAFVRDIIADPDDVSITRAIITLAHSLKLKVVAEGVETEGQLGLLIANHCDEIQGYYFSRPLPADEATVLLRAGRSLDSRMMTDPRRGRTLLLVDDEENILSALTRLLRRDGYDILTAMSAEQGLELLASNPVDVIVSDQRMPGMSGVEFLRRVKTLHPQTVRLVLSGYSDLQVVTDAINEGAIYKFLSKPWDDGILRANIEEAFRNKKQADENRRLQTEVVLANSQMAGVNAQLQKLLASKDRRVLRREASLDIAHEILQELPWPITGIDKERIIVFANAAADALLGDDAPLLGRSMDTSLPSPLLAALASSLTAEMDIDINGVRYHLRCSSMGEHSRAHHALIMLLPCVTAS